MPSYRSAVWISDHIRKPIPFRCNDSQPKVRLSRVTVAAHPLHFKSALSRIKLDNAGTVLPVLLLIVPMFYKWRYKRVAVSAVFGLAAGWLAPPIPARQTDSGTAVRPCHSSEASAAKKNAKPSKGKLNRDVMTPGEACIEVRASLLEAQEHLQRFLREQPWHVGEAEISESSWSFSITLSDKELLNFANRDAASKDISWVGGKALVLVSTLDLGDGFGRTTVTAKFEGFGESNDPLTVKRASWPLRSNGRLESMFVEALRDRYQSSH
jgi:hypothetical protein